MLPKLVTYGWRGLDASVEEISQVRVLVHDGLQELSITRCEMFKKEELMSIITTPKSLRTLEISSSSTDECFGADALTKILNSHPDLSTLALPGVNPPSHLKLLPTIKHLEAEFSTPDTELETEEYEAPLSLRTLVLRGDIAVQQHIIGTAQWQPSMRLSLWINGGQPTGEEFGDLFYVMESFREPKLEEFTVDIIYDFGMDFRTMQTMDGSLPVYVLPGDEFVAGISHFKNLRVLELLLAIPIDLSDDNFHQLTSALPNLTEFTIPVFLDLVPLAFSPRASLWTLVHFASNCPNLRLLSVLLDVSLDTDIAIPKETPRSSASSLCFGRSWIYSGGTVALVFQVLIELFPKVKSVRFEEQDDDYHAWGPSIVQPWEDVNKLLENYHSEAKNSNL